MTNSGRKTLILPWQGRWLAEGQTKEYPPLDSVTPLHHFVVPLPLQGRNLQPLLVVSRQSPTASAKRCEALSYSPNL